MRWGVRGEEMLKLEFWRFEVLFWERLREIQEGRQKP
jgi:hypothetical protein